VMTRYSGIEIVIDIAWASSANPSCMHVRVVVVKASPNG
jgi:hypothetical protein